MGVNIAVQYPETVLAKSIKKAGKYYVLKTAEGKKRIPSKYLISILKDSHTYYVQYCKHTTFQSKGTRTGSKGSLVMFQTPQGVMYVPKKRLRS